MESLPSILSSINSKEGFKEQFSSAAKIKSEWISLLIQMFGNNNARAICKLIGKDVKKLYKGRHADLEVLQQICFECLLQNKPVTANLLTDIYGHFSLHEGKLLHERMDQDTKDFLTADKTPQQTAKFFGLYRLEWIKELVDGIQEQCLKAVNNLSTGIFQDREKEERLLYNLSGLIWFGKTISYAEMRYAWSYDKKDVNLKTTSIYYKLLLEGKNCVPMILPEGPFPKHRIEVTLFTFFSHEKSCLPETKHMHGIAKELFELFSASEQAHQDAYCYVNKLHELFNPVTKAFDFNQALFALKSLELDVTGKLYHFLHTLLHYFRLLSVLSDNKALRPFLFYAIYLLPSDHLKEWDFPVFGSYPIKTFEVDKEICLFIQTHFELPHQWGLIFLNFIDPINRKYRYFEVNLCDHIELARIMEEFIVGEPLPMKLLTSFLQNQPATKSLLDVLKQLITFKQSQVPFTKFDWDNLCQQFMEALSPLDKDFFLKKNMEHLASTLGYAVYSHFKSSFTNRRFKEITSTFHEIIYEIEDNIDQDCQSYVRYLCKLSLEKSLFHLDALILDQSSKNYNILHAHFHAINVVNEIHYENEMEHKAIFRDILAVPLNKRKTFDQRIIEKKVMRVKVRFDQMDLLFDRCQGIFPEDRGETYLQIVQAQSKDISATSCRYYLMVQELDQLIQEMETVLMVPVPSEILKDIIFFRLTKKDISKIVASFKDIQDRVRIHNFCSQVSLLPLFEQITRLKKEFIQAFEDPALIFEFESPRHIRFKENIVTLADLIGQACYPPLALSSIKMKQNDTSFKLLHPKLTIEPFKMNFWIRNHGSEKGNFAMILKKEKVIFFFLLPFRIPKIEKERNLHFEAIEEAIKELLLGESQETIFVPFAKNLMENFTKAYYSIFHPEKSTFSTLILSKTGISIESKHLVGRVEIKEHSECLNDLFNVSKGSFSFRFNPQMGTPFYQEFLMERQQSENRHKVTLSTSHHSFVLEYPLFKNEKEWAQALLNQATLFFLQSYELEQARVIQGIEEILMMKLPKEILEELSSSVPAHSEKILSLLKEYKEIQDAVKTHDFSTLKIEPLFADLKTLREKFIHIFDYPSKFIMEELLRWACCPPSSLATFCINQEDFFSSSFQPLHPILPLGLLKLTRWIRDFKSGKWTFLVILKKEKTSCFFHIPFDVPLMETARSNKLECLDHAIKALAEEAKSNEFIPFKKALTENLTKGFYFLFESREVPFSTIYLTKEGLTCSFKGLEFKVKKAEHNKLKPLRKCSKGKFSFSLWSQDEIRSDHTIYIEWHEEQCKITLSLSQNNQKEKNSLTLTHPHFKSEEEWIDAVLYQSTLLYFQCQVLK